MTTEPFKIPIHMVSSLDGYIAKKDNSVSGIVELCYEVKRK